MISYLVYMLVFNERNRSVFVLYNGSIRSRGMKILGYLQREYVYIMRGKIEHCIL